MTIDEVEKIYKAITNEGAPCPRHCMLPCDKCVQECKQVLEWLEELKEIKENQHKSLRYMYEKGYNKAIDDFVEKLKIEYITYDIDHVFESSNFYSYTSACCIFEDYIERIAEQLKEGGNSGTDNQ